MSGNPAKRAALAAGKPVPQTEGEWQQPQPPKSQAEIQDAMNGFRLPPELQQMLNEQNKGPR